MRLFEILILVTILPTLVAYFFPPARRPQWLAYLPGIGLLFIVIHLIEEGYRVHMVFAYALTVILLLPTTRKIARRAPQPAPASDAHPRIRKAVAILGLMFLLIAVELLIAEGYRVHMVFAYALTGILLVPITRIIARRAPQPGPASDAHPHIRKTVAILDGHRWLAQPAMPIHA